MKKWLGVICIVLSGFVQADIVVGKDYTILPKARAVADPSKIEVLEFFSYDCIHCYKLEPALQAFQQKLPADVKMRKVHVMWGKSREGFAKLFATIQSTGDGKALQMSAFDAVMNQKQNLNNEKVLTAWLQKQKGINLTKFMGVYKSFATNSEVAKYAKLTKEYALEATPAVYVAGKYQVLPALPERVIQVTNELIAKERAARQAVAASKKPAAAAKVKK